MKTIKARGIVLKEYEAGESDKRLLLLCKGHGKLLVYARGACKPSSKFMASSQVFTYSDFVLAKGAGFHSVTQAEVIESFYPLRQDYDRLIAACEIAKIIERTLWDNINCDELLLLTLRSLSNLSKGNLPPLQITCVFLFRFFIFHGIQPMLDECVVCGEHAEGFLCNEGLVCEAHKTLESRPISQACLAALKFIQKNSLHQSFMFNAAENVLSELKQLADLLWRNYF